MSVPKRVRFGPSPSFPALQLASLSALNVVAQCEVLSEVIE